MELADGSAAYNRNEVDGFAAYNRNEEDRLPTTEMRWMSSAVPYY